MIRGLKWELLLGPVGRRAFQIPGIACAKAWRMRLPRAAGSGAVREVGVGGDNRRDEGARWLFIGPITGGFSSLDAVHLVS